MPILGQEIFGAVKLTKNADPDKSFRFGHGIIFDARGSASLSDGNWFGKDVNVWCRYELICAY